MKFWRILRRNSEGLLGGITKDSWRKFRKEFQGGGKFLGKIPKDSWEELWRKQERLSGEFLREFPEDS